MNDPEPNEEQWEAARKFCGDDCRFSPGGEDGFVISVESVARLLADREAALRAECAFAFDHAEKAQLSARGAVQELLRHRDFFIAETDALRARMEKAEAYGDAMEKAYGGLDLAHDATHAQATALRVRAEKAEAELAVAQAMLKQSGLRALASFVLRRLFGLPPMGE